MMGWWRWGEDPVLLFELGTTLSFRATLEVSWGLRRAWIVACFSLCLILLLSISFYWPGSSECSLVNFLLVNLCFRVCFLRNKICISIHGRNAFLGPCGWVCYVTCSDQWHIRSDMSHLEAMHLIASAKPQGALYCLSWQMAIFRNVLWAWMTVMRRAYSQPVIW